MLLDRIAQIALIFFGSLLLVLLVLGMAVSCRETSADPILTPTIAQLPITPDDTSLTLVAPLPSITTTVEIPVPSNSSPTPSSTSSSPDAASLTATVAPAQTITPAATVDPNAPTAAPTATTSTGIARGSTVRHVVSTGEWLLQIARCYGVSYESLRAANWIPYPDYILPGQVLSVPNVGALGAITGSPCVVAYTVATGDSWQSLAQRYGTTTAILQRANPGALTVGRSIWVPRLP